MVENEKNASLKQFSFRLITVLLVPILLLLIIESGLRILNVGYPTGFLKKLTIDNKDYFVDNPHFTYQYFPKSLARLPTPFIVPVSKQDKEIRIVILGASAALGDPAPELGFSRILELMLKERHPDYSFKIINAAIVAINSHVVRTIAEDVVDLQPDLFVVFLGNNEVIGPYGPGTAFTEFSRHLFVIRAGGLLRTTRTGQATQSLIDRIAGQTDVPRKWGGMGMFLENKLGAHDEALSGVYQHFEINLRDICETARDAEIECLVSTVPSNIRQSAPFYSVHKPDLTAVDLTSWDEHFTKGLEELRSGRVDEARDLLKEAEKIDDHHAELLFHLGRCHLKRGDHATAHQYFEKARDMDALRFRADSEINNIIRRLGAAGKDRGVRLIDAERVFERKAVYSSPGEDLFYEHVHMNFHGNYVLAEAVLPIVEDALLHRVGGAGIVQRSHPREVESGKRLGFTDWKLKEILGEDILLRMRVPPFSNQYDIREVLERWSEKLTALKGASDFYRVSKLEYEEALKQAGDDWMLHFDYGKMLMGNSAELEESLLHFERVAELIPNNYHAHIYRGVVLHELNRDEESLAAYERAIEFRPDAPVANLNIGLLMDGKGDHRRAETHWKKSLAIDPTQEALYLRLAKKCLLRGEIDVALEYLRRGTLHLPDSTRILEAHAGTLIEIGEIDAAKPILTRVRELRKEKTP